MNAEPQPPSLKDHLTRLIQPRADFLYYAFTLTVTETDEVLTQTHMTEFVDWYDADRRIEIRKPGLVIGRFAQVAWGNRGLPYMIVNEEEDLPLFLMAGGNALISQSIAQANLPELLVPHPSAYDAPTGYGCEIEANVVINDWAGVVPSGLETAITLDWYFDSWDVRSAETSQPRSETEA